MKNFLIGSGILIGFSLFVLIFVAAISHANRPADIEFTLDRVEYVTQGGVFGGVTTIFHATDGRAFAFPEMKDAPQRGAIGRTWRGTYRLEWK